MQTAANERRRLTWVFWRIVAATGTSALGDGLVFVAFPLLAVRLTANPVLVAGVTATGRLPWLLVSLPAGALADRVDRRRLVATVELVRAAVLVAFGLSVLAGQASLVALYAAAFAIGALETAFSAATRAVIPHLVDPADLPRANGYLFAAETVGEQFAGPAVGGLVFAWSSAVPFLADGASFVASAALLSTALGSQKQPVHAAPALSLFGQVGSGLRWFLSNPLLRLLAAIVATMAFCQAMVLSVLVLYGLHVLHLDRPGYGVFLTAIAVGDVGGSLVAGRIHDHLGTSRGLLTAGAVAAVGYVLLAATSTTAVAAIAMCGEAIGVAIGNVATMSLRQRVIPLELFGLVNNAFRMCVVGVIPFGAITGGLLVAAVGLHGTFLVAGVVQACVLGLVARKLVNRLRTSHLP